MAAPVPFQSFFEQHAPTVGRYVRAFLPASEIDECVQETFIAALRAYDRFDGRNPRGWVLAIARRKAIDLQRARARRPDPVGELAGEQSADTGAGERPLDGEIWRQVAELPEKQRAALVLRYGLDLPHREIGVVLGCSEAAARRNVHEGVARLRRARTEEVA